MSQRTPESEELFKQLLITNQTNINKLIGMVEQQMIYINSFFFVSKNSIEEQENQTIQVIDNQPVTEKDQTIRDKAPVN